MSDQEQKVERLHPVYHPELGCQMRPDPRLAGGYVRCLDHEAALHQARQAEREGIREAFFAELDRRHEQPYGGLDKDRLHNIKCDFDDALATLDQESAGDG